MYDASLPYSKDPHFLNAVIDTLEEGIVVQSDQGKIVGFNDKALSLLAVSADQLMGDSSNSERWTAIDLDENIIPTENHPIVLTLRTQQPQYNVIMGVTTGDNQLKWFSVNTRMTDVGEEKFVVAAFTDITQLIVLNKSLHEQNKLQLQIQDELEKKIKQLKDFAGIITHDVRGPANNIKKLLQVYESKKDEESGQQAFQYLKQASNDLYNNLNELIKLLQWHLDQKSPFSTCDFDAITNSVLVQLDHLIQQKYAVIYRDFNVASFDYAKVYLHSILYNLISNALKYSREDAPLEIRLESFMENGRVCLRVSDNGKGIDMDKFGATLFRFQRNTEVENDSKGIGLYLVQHQVNELGGYYFRNQ
ncbi:MAG: PAS domain-containing sensor histidine kinase [Sediminibacterium sp.]|jgi:PAS domain S-box-containing protein|uniref:sensor histidine kinase n=1 Tax=Sediminibacterium sp. TaxID=1917865 RepID=UPI002ABB6197|nr:PAS domain-containing sensor histidine kinase [Sediminibacterium sp.]MDZ4072602.1 PAS domain-containing sensor histidine kinase [Sediminibacterium sp.]